MWVPLQEGNAGQEQGEKGALGSWLFPRCIVLSHRVVQYSLYLRWCQQFNFISSSRLCLYGPLFQVGEGCMSLLGGWGRIRGAEQLFHPRFFHPWNRFDSTGCSGLSLCTPLLRLWPSEKLKGKKVKMFAAPGVAWERTVGRPSRTEETGRCCCLCLLFTGAPTGAPIEMFVVLRGRREVRKSFILYLQRGSQIHGHILSEQRGSTPERIRATSKVPNSVPERLLQICSPFFKSDLEVF